MGVVNWTGAAVFDEIAAGTVRGMKRAETDGVDAAKAQSKVDTGFYRSQWREREPVLQGDTVHGGIDNDADYSRWVSGGTSRQEGDFAHAAALDTAASRLVGYIAQEVNLS